MTVSFLFFFGPHSSQIPFSFSLSCIPSPPLCLFLSTSPCLPLSLPPVLSDSLSPGCLGWWRWGVQTSQRFSVPARCFKKIQLPGLGARHASCDWAPVPNTVKLPTFHFHQP